MCVTTSIKQFVSSIETLGATLPRLIPLDFLAWGFIKSKVHKTKFPNLPDLRQRIYEALTPNLLRYVFKAAVEPWEQCLEMEGGGQVQLYRICYTTVTSVTCLT